MEHEVPHSLTRIGKTGIVGQGVEEKSRRKWEKSRPKGENSGQKEKTKGELEN